MRTAASWAALSLSLLPVGLFATRGFAQAPMRSILTTAPTSAIAPKYKTASVEKTYQVVFPLEANGSAIRFAIADQYAGAMQIVAASLYASDSYSGLVQQGAVSRQGPLATFPTVNSVFETCTLVKGSEKVVCPTTANLPAAATLYVIAKAETIQPNVTATVSSPTTVKLSRPALISGTPTLQFANLAPECIAYFDNQGAPANIVNTNGVNRGLFIPGNPQSTGTAPQPYTLQWSDLVPCTTRPRADGGTQPLIFAYITLAATSTYGAGGGNYPTYNAQIAPQFGNRYVFETVAKNTNADFSDQPAGSAFVSSVGVSPFLAFSYVSDVPGWNVLQTGDSISTAPPDDNLSSGVWRGCKSISTPQLPCEWASVAWGGEPSTVYNVALANNISALNPSALVAQPISRNDYPTVYRGSFLGSMQNLLTAEQGFVQGTDMVIGFYGAFPFTTTLDDYPTYQAAVATMRSELAGIAQQCQPNAPPSTCPLIPVLDPVPVVSRALLGGNSWDYLGIGFTANGADPAGSTQIAITSSNRVQSCYIGDLVTDTTNPAAIAPGSTATAVSATTITVGAGAVTGSGIAAKDQLVCSMPGWTGGALSFDNTHPWYPSWTLLQPESLAFVAQLLTGSSQSQNALAMRGKTPAE
jgi:hypothetical protein